MLNFCGVEHSPNCQFLGAMFTAWHYVADVALLQIKKTNEQNFPYFNPCRLIKNKINRLHKTTYKELLEKDWQFLTSSPEQFLSSSYSDKMRWGRGCYNCVSVHQKKLAVSYYGIIEIIWNKFLDFFCVVFVKKKSTNALLKHPCGKMS